MKIAFFTPLNPLKSGISDFCEELLPYLKEEMEVDLFIEEYKPTNIEIKNSFKIRRISEFENEAVRKEYDQVIYQIGNNETCHESIYNMALKYPGIIELHDISLHHMLAATTIARGDVEKYKSIMEYCHGIGAVQEVDKFLRSEILPPWENNSLIFTVNKELIDSAKGVIVHSDYAKQMVKGVRSDVPIEVIYLHADEIDTNYIDSKMMAREQLGLLQEELIFATFGFITKPKRILETLEVLKVIKEKGYKFKFYIVGKVADQLNVTEVIKQNNLEDEVVVTGFVTLEKMKQLMKASDICFCLRYPTQGESSAIVHRLLGMGKIMFVTNVGTFSEYPDDVAIKINIEHETEEMIEKILYFLQNKDEARAYEAKALEFAIQYCTLSANAKMYKAFIENLSIWEETDVEEMIAEAFYALNIRDEEVIRKVINYEIK